MLSIIILIAFKVMELHDLFCVQKMRGDDMDDYYHMQWEKKQILKSKKFMENCLLRKGVL